MEKIPQSIGSALAEAAPDHTDELTALQRDNEANNDPPITEIPTVEEAPTATTADTINSEAKSDSHEKPYVSNIRVLTSSLPQYHNAFMEARKKDQERSKFEDQNELLDSIDEDMLSPLAPVVSHRSPEEKNAMLRHLKPHSRSTIQLQNLVKDPILRNGNVSNDSRPKPRNKSLRWQFGIRSRNDPADAIKCLYKALKAMGDCEWETHIPKRSKDSERKGPYPINIEGAQNLSTPYKQESPEVSRRQSPSRPPSDHRVNRHHRPPSPIPDTPTDEASDSDPDPAHSDSEDDDDIDPGVIPDGYVPKDPWVIKVRWTKKGMSPPNMVANSSAQSSAVDLRSTAPSTIDPDTRRGSLVNSVASAAGSTTSVGLIPTNPSTTAVINADTTCFVYLDVQLYVIEQDNYLIDFKNSGYETIVGEEKVWVPEKPTRKRGDDDDGDDDDGVNGEGTMSEGKGGKVDRDGVKRGENDAGQQDGKDGDGAGHWETRYIGSGNRKAEKDVTSPQPYLDLANRLVIYLARG